MATQAFVRVWVFVRVSEETSVLLAREHSSSFRPEGEGGQDSYSSVNSPGMEFACT